MTKAKLAATVAACAAAIAGSIAIWHFGRSTNGAPSNDAIVTNPAATELYTCGMHTQVVQEGPGQCPICGMNLTPMDGGLEALENADSVGVRVNKRFLQNFAVRSTLVQRADLPARIRTIGYLDRDEAKLVSVTTKVGGWIERPRVNTVGERVSEGDVLLEIYSPELLTAQEEYLASMEYVARLQAAEADPAAVSRAQSLLRAATERLRHLDLTGEQISDLEASMRAGRTLEIHSPASGYVVEKVADSLEGFKATPGTTILKIADHSTLWAKVEFYEHYLRDLRVGLSVDISLDAFPGRRWSGRLLFFEPSMNPQTQTLTGYVEVDNADGRLRPKMYATIEIQLPGARGALVVPAQSVLRFGSDRNVVIVDAGDGVFVPHEVELGIESDGKLQVLDGLAEGERVVTSSQFLLDSESNLRAAVGRLASGSGHSH